MRNTPTTERETLFVTDEELMKRLGVSPQVGRPALEVLDRDQRSCFPKKDPLWGNRRYWPAVKMFLDRTHGLERQREIPVTIRDRKTA